MQVRSSRITCRANCTNYLALPNRLAFPDFFLIEVQVFGHIGLSMLDEDIVAVGFAVAGGLDLAVTGGKYRGASWCCVVDPTVGFDHFMDRVFTFEVKSRANAEYIQRCAQESFAHT